jgi:hypothetical protein
MSKRGMNKRDMIEKMTKNNLRVDAKMIQEAFTALEIVRAVRVRRKRRRSARRFDLESPFTTIRPDGTVGDPRAVYF